MPRGPPHIHMFFRKISEVMHCQAPTHQSQAHLALVKFAGLYDKEITNYIVLRTFSVHMKSVEFWRENNTQIVR
jgi:hypothetical protein